MLFFSFHTCLFCLYCNVLLPYILRIIDSDILFIVFWLLLFFGYGNLVLSDSVVLVEGMVVDEWLAGFRMCGGISGILGFICVAICFSIGDGFAGESGISVKYYGLLIVSFVFGVAANFLFLPASQEGSGCASLFVIIFPMLLYYLSSLIVSAPQVKYIPPLSEVIHK